jgi:hypothetical protein
VGGGSRYDRDRPVSDIEAQEAWAYRELGGVLMRCSTLVLDGPTRRALAEVLHATAIELNAGRAVPLGVRRAVGSVADALRVALDPTISPATPQSPQPGNTSRSGAGPSGVTAPRFTAATTAEPS